MKKIIITKATWTLLIAGSIMFGACKNNNDNSTASNIDTPANVSPVLGSQNSTLLPGPSPVASAGTAATNNSATTNTTPGTSVIAANGCPVPAHKAAKHKYNGYTYAGRHRSVRKKAKVATFTEENTVATVEPQAPPVTHNEEIVNVEKPVQQPALETHNEYLGNVTTTTVPKKRAVVHFGLEAGGNLNNLYRMSDDFQTSNMLKVGFNAGAVMNVRLGNRFAVEPGLRYIMKGAVIKSSSSDGITSIDEKDKLTLHYIEMPVNFIYNAGDWGTGHFMIGVGPYASYLVNAQDKSKVTTTNIYEGTTVAEGQHSLPVGNRNTPGNVSYYDLGAGGFVGYQFKTGTYVKAGAEVGLVDLQENLHTLGNFNDRNYNFLLSVGYMMGYKK